MAQATPGPEIKTYKDAMREAIYNKDADLTHQQIKQKQEVRGGADPAILFAVLIRIWSFFYSISVFLFFEDNSSHPLGCREAR